MRQGVLAALLLVAGPIDDDAQRTIGIVFAQIGNCLRKITVAHAGHGDQQMVLEVAAFDHGFMVGSLLQPDKRPESVCAGTHQLPT